MWRWTNFQRVGDRSWCKCILILALSRRSGLLPFQSRPLI
jgi:hypothetical protein